MKISIIVEGKTEETFKRYLQKYLTRHLAGRMPKLDFLPCVGRIHTGNELKRTVEKLLSDKKDPSDHVIALTDVYTGSRPPEFTDAHDAKEKMRQWVGNESRFHPHAAQYDFEAWLLPYWPTIQRISGNSNASPPSNHPERVNHSRPPAHILHDVFRRGGRRYVKPRDAGKILKENDLSTAISECSELKAFINTILTICGEAPLP